MYVLEMIGIAVGLIALYIFFEYMNEVTEDRYNYKFFSFRHLAQIAIGYWFIYLGQGAYIAALENNGDLLNGVLLVLIGLIIVLAVIYKNFKQVPLSLALFLSAIELLIALPLAIAFLLGLIVLGLFAAQTKPVYVVND